MVLDRQAEEPTALYEGIPCQRVARAIGAAAPAIGKARAERAAETALGNGYITEAEKDLIVEDLR